MQAPRPICGSDSEGGSVAWCVRWRMQPRGADPLLMSVRAHEIHDEQNEVNNRFFGNSAWHASVRISVEYQPDWMRAPKLVGTVDAPDESVDAVDASEEPADVEDASEEPADTVDVSVESTEAVDAPDTSEQDRLVATV
jgi:hypothetical protein